jgi:hypothetical protein
MLLLLWPDIKNKWTRLNNTILAPDFLRNVLENRFHVFTWVLHWVNLWNYLKWSHNKFTKNTFIPLFCIVVGFSCFFFIIQHAISLLYLQGDEGSLGWRRRGRRVSSDGADVTCRSFYLLLTSWPVDIPFFPSSSVVAILHRRWGGPPLINMESITTERRPKALRIAFSVGHRQTIGTSNWFEK